MARPFLALLLVALAGLALWFAPGPEATSEPNGAPTPTPRPRTIQAPGARADASPADEGREPARSSHPARPIRTLRGIVADVRDQPLGGVALTLLAGPAMDPERAQTLAVAGSGPRGEFAFSFAPPADAPALFVHAALPGFVEAVVPVGSDAVLRVRLRARSSDLVLVGRVVDGQGRPLPAFEIHEQVRLDGPTGPTVQGRWTRVDQPSDGFEFALAALRPETLDLHLRAPGFQDHTRSLPLDGARRIELGEIVLAAGSACWGKVVDGSGAPLGGVVLEPRLRSGTAPRPSRTRDEDGGFAFSIGAEEDLDSIFFHAPDRAPRWIHAAEVQGAWQDLTVLLDSGARVTGQVRRNGEALAGARLQAWSARPDGGDLPGGDFGTSPWIRTARADGDGIYVFERVPSGPLRVGVLAADRPSDLVRIEGLVVRGEPVLLLDVDLDAGATLTGAVRLPDFLPPETLRVELRRPALDPAVSGTSGTALASAAPVEGRFRFDGVPRVRDLTLRIYVAPHNFVERPVPVDSDPIDLGTFDFSSPRSLLEFNRPGQEFFALVPASGR